MQSGQKRARKALGEMIAHVDEMHHPLFELNTEPATDFGATRLLSCKITG